VDESVAAARVLRGWDARRLYQKYCSTFDSKDAGNIGPVTDALLAELPPDAVSVGTPATPAAGRTMHRGHLFVGDRLLSESSLAQHPLTPMTDPDLIRVLGRQTPHRICSVPIEVVHEGAGAIGERIGELRTAGVRHVLLDAVEDSDLDAAAEALVASDAVLVGGAAGLAVAFARRLGTDRPLAIRSPPAGRTLILSGSGSERTRSQVAAHTGPLLALDVDALAADANAVVEQAVEFVRTASGVPLISATVDPGQVRRVQERWGVECSAALVEDALSRIAALAVERLDARRILVAGGETSGAVAARLGVRALRVRRVIAPGVAWTSATDAEGRALDLCFKSGNFGGERLFVEAWDEEEAS
jgi:uncharacterized protein YgbK (DUF1537 family)